MSVYDSPADVPNQIKTEGEKIAVSWKPGVPTASTPGVANSAEGTISWNIPSPARGCATRADGTSAYCGIIVLASTTPFTTGNRPVDGEFYAFPDPTVDPDVHAGDKIGGALVVGAFYEGEKKAQGEDLTTELVVSGVDAETPYYIMVHAVDCQFRYHKDGMRAYSAALGGGGTPDTNSTQEVELGSGVTETDLTGLLPTGSPLGSPIPSYAFDLLVSDTYPNATADQVLHIEFDATEAETYGDLLNAIRDDIAQSVIDANPFGGAVTGPGSPCTLASSDYCLDQGVIKQYDGTNFNAVYGVMYEPADPTNVSITSYWYISATDVLRHWNPGLPGWEIITYLTSEEDPVDLTSCDNIWFDGTTAYSWCENTWCEEELVISTTDPSLPPDLGCCAVWYDQTNEQLFAWNDTTSSWDEAFAVMWDTAPNMLAVGTYWFDDTNDLLFQRVAASPEWVEIPNVASSPVPGSPLADRLIISEDEPTAPAEGLHWYNPLTEELKVYTSGVWVDTPVLVWPTDPTDTESCDLWWNTVDGNLYRWDTVNLEWDQVIEFIKSPTDPTIPPVLDVGLLWYNPDTGIMQYWNGSAWMVTEFIDSPTDPTAPAFGTVWFKPSTGEWFEWSTLPSPDGWTPINPIDTNQDPANPTQGALWFDLLTQTLNEWQGSPGAWVTIPYTSGCTLPVRGFLWYNRCDETLYEWDSVKWVNADDKLSVTVSLNSIGNLQFTTPTVGSSSLVMVVVPSGVPSEIAGQTGYGCLPVVYTEITRHSFAFYGPDPCLLPPAELQGITSANGVNANNFLFSAINIAKILPQQHGFDGVSDIPSYLEDGVGTDGTPDERRALIDWIRQQLGYPSIKVELTNQQLDTSVRKALDIFRMRSSLGYKRGFYFLDVIPGLQEYKLTSKQNGYNKIVNVMGAYRFTSAFLSTAHGAGVYGQVVLQHLYNMGTFDLTSFHLISQYIEQLEHLFATRLTYHWDEPSRVISLYSSFVRHERILLETSYERTEQEIMTDRWSKNWIERWAISEAMLILAQIRGKFASLPGAGGGVSLNAADLTTRAEGEQERLLDDLNEYIGQDVEDYGMGTAFVIG